MNCLSDPDDSNSTPDFAQNIVGLWYNHPLDSVIHIRGYTEELYYFKLILPTNMDQRALHDTLDYLWSCSTEKQLKINTDSSFLIQENYTDCDEENHVEYDWKPEFDSSETYVSDWYIYRIIMPYEYAGVTIDSIYEFEPSCLVSYSFQKSEPILKRMDYTPKTLTREQCAGR